MTLLLEQLLNGVQFGVFLFLVSAGLTLVLGIMNVVNLAHGSLYMLGAYFAATFYAWTGSLWIAFFLMVPASLLIGILVEIITLRRLYSRSHMDQVLATFGLILFFNEGVKMIWGAESQNMPIPESLSDPTLIFEIPYPTYRLVIIGVGLLIAIVLFLFISRTRTGMLIRAGASNGPMIRALGVNIRLLYTIIFGMGSFLAGLAGLMAGPILSVESGMGEDMLILAFVVIVIGGIGSIRGAVVASILVGVFDVIGRSFLPDLLLKVVASDIAETAGPALASMLIYLLMILVLFFRPEGLFPAGAR